MTIGRTVLCLQDPGKVNAVDKYRPIFCLPVMWKFISGALAEEIHSHMGTVGIFPAE